MMISSRLSRKSWFFFFFFIISSYIVCDHLIWTDIAASLVINRQQTEPRVDIHRSIPAGTSLRAAHQIRPPICHTRPDLRRAMARNWSRSLVGSAICRHESTAEYRMMKLKKKRQRRLVGRGENLVGPGTSVSGGVRTRSVYLNCHGRARPNTE